MGSVRTTLKAVMGEVESKPSPSSLAARFRRPAFRPAACSSREIRTLISMKIGNACLKRVRSRPRVCAILTQLLALAFVPALFASSSAWTVSGIRDTGFSQQNKVTAAISPNVEVYSVGVPSFGAFCACSGPTLTLGDPSASLFFLLHYQAGWPMGRTRPRRRQSRPPLQRSRVPNKYLHDWPLMSCRWIIDSNHANRDTDMSVPRHLPGSKSSP